MMKKTLAALFAALIAGCQGGPETRPEPNAGGPDPRLEYTERQIAELYGPLTYFCQEGYLSVTSFLRVLGRDYIFPTDGTIIAGKDRERWLFWAENDLFVRNEEIRKFIKHRAHLVEGDQIPKSFALLLEHQQSWSVNHHYWKESAVLYPLHADTSWPGSFNRHVLETYATLKDRHAARLKELPPEAERRHIERQLEELYAPLAALNAEDRMAHKNVLRTFGRDTVLPEKGGLAGAELQKWLFLVEHDILPRGEQRKNLIRAKMHLLDGNAIPKSYLDFLRHHQSWKMEHLYWKSTKTPYSWVSRFDRPAAFFDDVDKTYARLKARHRELLGR